MLLSMPYLCLPLSTATSPHFVPDLPPLDCLRFFDAAARHRSFARAAEELGVTPAAVAHRIRMLEAHLRAPLFSRRARSVRLTEPGSRYHADIQRVLEDVLGATRRFRRSRVGPRPPARG